MTQEATSNVAKEAAIYLQYVAKESALSLRAAAPPAELTGVMKGLLDDYCDQYDAEKAHYADSMTGMEDVIAHAKDDEARASAVDEKIRMGHVHDAKIQGLVGFVRALDNSMQTMSVTDTPWMIKFP